MGFHVFVTIADGAATGFTHFTNEMLRFAGCVQKNAVLI
jgi:hypothetical protein